MVPPANYNQPGFQFNIAPQEQGPTPPPQTAGYSSDQQGYNQQGYNQQGYNPPDQQGYSSNGQQGYYPPN